MSHARWHGGGSLRGMGGDNADNNLVDHDLRYNWNLSPGFSNTELPANDPAFVRMISCEHGIGASPIPATAGSASEWDAANGFADRKWLIFNEPDDAHQCGRSVPMRTDGAYAATRFIEYATAIREGNATAQIFVGGMLNISSDTTRGWWVDFLDALEATTYGDGTALSLFDGVHVHGYPEFSRPCLDNLDTCAGAVAEALNDYHRDVHEADARTSGKPLWLTEIGWLHYGHVPGDDAVAKRAWVRAHFLRPMIRWFEALPDSPAATNRGYDAMFWFYLSDNWGGDATAATALTTFDGSAHSLTSLGEEWNAEQHSLFFPRVMR